MHDLASIDSLRAQSRWACQQRQSRKGPSLPPWLTKTGSADGGTRVYGRQKLVKIFDGCCYESKSRRPSLPSRLPKTGRVDGGPRVYGQQKLVDIFDDCCDESKSRRPSLPPRPPKIGRADGGPRVCASNSSWTSSTAAAPFRGCSRSSGTSSTPPLSGNTQKQLRLSSQADAARMAGMRPTEYTLMQNEARGISRFPGSVCLAVAEAEPRVEAEAEAEPRAKSAA